MNIQCKGIKNEFVLLQTHFLYKPIILKRSKNTYQLRILAVAVFKLFATATN